MKRKEITNKEKLLLLIFQILQLKMNAFFIGFANYVEVEENDKNF